MLRHGAGFFLGFACLAGHRAAHAQVIDQYLNTDIPGYAAEAGVTVASRTHPEYEASGVRLGSFVFTPVLEESIGYDDNVTGTRDARGSPLIETNASLGAAGGWSDTSFGAALGVQDYEYPSQSSQSYTNWNAALGASHDFGRDQLAVGYTHLNLNQTPRDLNVPDLDQTIAYRVDDLRGTYRLDLGRLTITPVFDAAYYSFDNGRVGNLPYLQSYRNRVVLQPSIVASYEFATRRRVVIVVRDAQADFDSSPPGLPRQNFNDLSALAGLAYDADGVIGFRILGGYEERSFSSDIYRMIQAPIVEASATWTPTGLTTITGSAARYIEDSASEATVGYTETALKLAIDHEYLRNVIFSANLGYTTDDYERGPGNSGGGSQSFFTGGVGAQWKLNRHWRLAANYSYSQRRSSNGAALPTTFLADGEVFGSNYSENLFLVTLRLAL